MLRFKRQHKVLQSRVHIFQIEYLCFSITHTGVHAGAQCSVSTESVYTYFQLNIDVRTLIQTSSFLEMSFSLEDYLGFVSAGAAVFVSTRAHDGILKSPMGTWEDLI